GMALLLTLGISTAPGPLTDARQRKRRHKVTLCFNNETIEVNKKRKKSYLKQGASAGSCPPPVVECRGFQTGGQPGKYCRHGEFQQCCPWDTKCCPPSFDGNDRNSCAPLHYRCCPAETNAGACAPDQQCCPPPPYEPKRGACAGPNDRLHCCPPN